jgi:hypothetical protein
MGRFIQSRAALRTISVSLSFLLAFGVMTTLPTTAYADEEFVCMIGDVGYWSIDDALSHAQDGDTIILLTDIEKTTAEEVWETSTAGWMTWYYVAINISGRCLTIDTNGFILEIGKRIDTDVYGNVMYPTSYWDHGLYVSHGGCLDVVDSSEQQTGQFNVTGFYPVRVDGIGSSATVSNIVGAGTHGSLAQNGGTITVTGDVSGSTVVAARAESGGSITVYGNVTTDADTALIATGMNSSIEIYESVICTSGNNHCVALSTSENANIKVCGDVTSGRGCGAYAEGIGSYVEIGGNCSVDHGTGIQAVGGATVTVNGTLTAADYIMLGISSENSTLFTKESGVQLIGKPDYYEYTDGRNHVYIKSEGSINRIGVGDPGSGDFDGDGSVTMSEVMIALRVVVGIGADITQEQFAAIDIDFDGVLTMVDVMLMIRKACGLV